MLLAREGLEWLVFVLSSSGDDERLLEDNKLVDVLVEVNFGMEIVLSESAETVEDESDLLSIEGWPVMEESTVDVINEVSIGLDVYLSGLEDVASSFDIVEGDKNVVDQLDGTFEVTLISEEVVNIEDKEV